MAHQILMAKLLLSYARTQFLRPDGYTRELTPLAVASANGDASAQSIALNLGMGGESGGAFERSHADKDLGNTRGFYSSESDSEDADSDDSDDSDEDEDEDEDAAKEDGSGTDSDEYAAARKGRKVGGFAKSKPKAKKPASAKKAAKKAEKRAREKPKMSALEAATSSSAAPRVPG